MLALPGELKKFLARAQRGELEVRFRGIDEHARLIYALGHQIIYAALGITAGAFAHDLRRAPRGARRRATPGTRRAASPRCSRCRSSATRSQARGAVADTDSFRGETDYSALGRSELSGRARRSCAPLRRAGRSSRDRVPDALRRGASSASANATPRS